MRHSAVAYCVGNNQVIASDVVKSGIFINPHSLVILAIGIKVWRLCNLSILAKRRDL
jgi:hypothetical protein